MSASQQANASRQASASETPMPLAAGIVSASLVFALFRVGRVASIEPARRMMRFYGL